MKPPEPLMEIGATMEPGRVVAGRFVVERLVGAGGMGAVFAAIDREDGTRVALKVLRDDASTEALRFADEARVLAELAHPAIVRHVDHGVTPEGQAYLAMEWLQGEDLEQRLARGRMTVLEATIIARRMGQALSLAHSRGVLHRDIKPSNVFLVHGDASSLKLIDFGIARRMAAPRGLTGMGRAIGTVGYMAPEQVRAEALVDARVDVFALGCVLFECLTGHKAFEGDDVMGVLVKILLQEPPRPRGLCPEVPPALDALVRAMLSKEPLARPLDGSAVVRALDDIAMGGPAPLEVVGSSGGPPAGTEAALPMLTRREQALVTIVLVEEPDVVTDALGATLPFVGVPANTDSLRIELEAMGARFEVLSGGLLVAVLRTSASAREQADTAARGALVLSEALPDRRVVVSTGNVEIADQLPLGELIDRAVRTLRAAEDDPRSDVVCPILDQVTAGLMSPRFQVESSGGRLLLRGERAMGDAVRSLLGRKTPCLGREAELATLESLFARCSSEKAPRAGLVTGPPGMGKSRIRYEVLRRIIDRVDWPTVALASADPTHTGSPLGLIAQLVRHAFGVLDGEPTERTDQRLRDRLGRLVAVAELPRITAFLGEILQIGAPASSHPQLASARLDQRLMADQIRRAWLDWLEAECAFRSMVLAIEDVHAADPPSIKLLQAALTDLQKSSLMVIAFGRPEAAELFPELWSSPRATSIALGELPLEASIELVRLVLGETHSEEAAKRIAERAAGNAFYLEEIIRAHVENDTDAIPETVLAMAQARISSFAEETRRILRAASIFGRAFWQRGVMAMLGDATTGPNVSGLLRELTEREVISPRRASRFALETEYVFRHGLLRDAAYSMLVEGDRVLGHRLCGDWLERVGEQDAHVLATHFDRGEERARAMPYYVRAAEHALQKGDLSGAIVGADNGIRCGAAGESRGRLRLVVAEASLWRGEFAVAEDAAQEAMALSPIGGAAWYGSVALVVASAYSLGHEAWPEELVDAIVRSHPDREVLAIAIASAARIASHLGAAGLHPLCDRLLGWITEHQRGAPGLDDLTTGLVALARGLRVAARGDLSAFLHAMRVSTAAFSRAGDLRRASHALGNCGFASAELGLYAEAEVALRSAERAAQRAGLANAEAYAKHNLGAVLARRGEWREAEALERQAIHVAAEQGDKRLESGARIYLAKILAGTGDLAGAEREARLSLQLSVMMPARKAMALGTLAEVLRKRDPVEALARAREAVAIIEVIGGLDEMESQIRLLHADLLTERGAPEAGASVRRAAERLNERSRMILDLELRRSFMENVSENAATLARLRAVEARESS